MTQEALKLALEALNDMACWQEGREVDIGFDEPYAADTSRKAIIAIKEALAQTQEPVAWRNAAIRVGEAFSSVGPDGYYDMTAQQWLDWALSVVTVHAPPPQRTQVDLTDEEVFGLFGRFTAMTGKSWLDLYRMTEAKRKEKTHMNTCPNCGKVTGLHSSILQGCKCQHSMQKPKIGCVNYDCDQCKAQRTWVDLTAEQMLECNMDGDWTTDRETAKLNVQAKLKELNT